MGPYSGPSRLVGTAGQSGNAQVAGRVPPWGGLFRIGCGWWWCHYTLHTAFFAIVVRGVYPPYTLSGPTTKKKLFYVCLPLVHRDTADDIAISAGKMI